VSHEPYPTGRDTSVTHLDPSLEVTALAVTADELEPLDPNRVRSDRLGVSAWRRSRSSPRGPPSQPRR
jgi:hypothetical protein